MFSSYIKNLNEMVFPTQQSDGSEDQPSSSSSSVLGRLGSWLWARSPISSTDNASPTTPNANRPVPTDDQDALTEDVFYPVSQQDEEDTPEDEWEEASSSLGRPTLFPDEPEPQPGRRLHVYLEETSVCGSAAQEVVCTFSKSLPVRPKSRSSVSVDSERGHSFSSALVGVSLSSGAHKAHASGSEDEMGRRNARRRYRRNSQESSEAADKDKPSPKSTAAAESPAPSAAAATPDPAPSDKSHSSSPGRLNSGQVLLSAKACSGSEAGQAKASMEADDSFYRVERRTETPESKRRSIKVSKSQIKLFTKNVPLQPRSNMGVELPTATARGEELTARGEELTARGEELTARGEELTAIGEEPAARGEEQSAKDQADPRLKDAKKPEDKNKPGPGPGCIADKISLFENRKLGGPQLFNAPRSADVSPIRKPTGRLKAEQALSELRSRSDECLGKKRSSSTSPPRQKGLTIKERVRNFNDACSTTMTATAVAGPKQNVSRIRQKITASKSLEILDSPDTDQKAISKADTEARAWHLKTEMVDQKDMSKSQRKDAKDASQRKDVNDTSQRKEVNEASKRKDENDVGQRKDVNNASKRKDESDPSQRKDESDPSQRKDESDASQRTDVSNVNKAPMRTGSRSKKRRSKESASPKTEQKMGATTKQDLDTVDGSVINKENGVSAADSEKSEKATQQKKDNVESVDSKKVEEISTENSMKGKPDVLVESSVAMKKDEVERTGKSPSMSKKVAPENSIKTNLDVTAAKEDGSIAKTKKYESEMKGKIQSTSKKVEEIPPESSMKTKLDVLTAKKDAGSATIKKKGAERTGKANSTNKIVEEMPQKMSLKTKLDVLAERTKKDKVESTRKNQSTSKKVEDTPPESSTKAKLDVPAAKDDTMTNIDEVERKGKNAFTNKEVEETPPESSTKAKEDVAVSVRQESIIEHLQNHDNIIPSLSIKPPREEIGNKVDSYKNQDEVTDTETSSEVVKVTEELDEKEQVKTSDRECDLNNKEVKASFIYSSDIAAQESKETQAATIKQGESITLQQRAIFPAESEETATSEHNLCAIKQAASSAIDKTLPQSADQSKQATEHADKTKENVPQEAPGDKADTDEALTHPSVALNKVDLSGFKEEAAKGDGIEVCKRPPSDENKADVKKQMKAQAEVGVSSEVSGVRMKMDEKPQENVTVVEKDNKDLEEVKQVAEVEVVSELDGINVFKHESEVLKNVDKNAQKKEMITETSSLLQKDKSGLGKVNQIASDANQQTERQVEVGVLSEVSEGNSSKSESEKAESQEKVTITEKGAEKSALSVSEPEMDTSDKTKTPIDKSPAVLPPNEQQITGQNSAPFTRGLDLPAMAQNTNKSKATVGLMKPGVIENGEKLVNEKETEAFGEQGLGNEELKSGQEYVEKSDAKKQKKASNNAPAAVESVGAEHSTVSVEDNEGEREGRTQTITESTETHGKEETPPEPQAQCVTAEKKIQACADDSDVPPRPFTVLTRAKSDISEQKAAVDRVRGTEEGGKESNNVDCNVGGNKTSSESTQLVRDLIREAGSEFEKAITNTASGRISQANELDASPKEEAAAANKQAAKTLREVNKASDSPRKRLNFPKGRSKDDWDLAQRQDAPSSWLDVDFPKQKLRVSNEAKLTSSGSESNLLDTSADLDDEDFVERIKKLCAPFQLPPRKHNHLRHPQPPFAMPAIKEARIEKTFDPEEFTFGLRKKSKFSLETPSLMAKLQSSEAKSSIKPARASLADRSMLLSGLERFRDKPNGKDEQDDTKDKTKDEAKDEIKVKSRLEGSCVLNSLTTSSFRSKLSPSPAQAESTDSGIVSPSSSPQQPGPPPLGPTETEPEEEGPSVEQCAGGDSGPPLPAFNRIKLPGFLEKFFPREQMAEAQRRTGREQTVNETKATMSSVKEEAQEVPDNKPDVPQKDLNQETEATMLSVKEEALDVPEIKPDVPQKDVNDEAALKRDTLKESAPSPPGEQHADAKVAVNMSVVDPMLELKVEEQKPPKTVANHFAGISLKDKAPPPQTPPRRRPSPKIRAARGFHRRPGKMLLFEKAAFEGQLYEIHRDMEDATALLLSALISVRVVRGCWVLYEKPGFQGRTIALEEGSLELANVWAEPGADPEAPSHAPMQIGSIRLAVSDYSVPHIDLYTEPEGRGRVSPYHDDALETGSFGIPLSTASIQVHSGVWLVFSDPGFQGMLAVLEPGGYPFPETWGFPSPFVGSLRPLKMGGFKVENPNEIKAALFEKAGFEGRSLDIETDVFSFGDEDADSAALQTMGSLKVHGGLWVGYSEPGFEGQQYILEEGEYLDCGDWGGAEILSIRPILADFMSPHLKMFSDRDLGKMGVNIDLTVPVISLEETGYGLKTQSMDVLSGVWAVFEEPGFCGDSYIVEKGQYGSPEDWGAIRSCIASAMPVLLENFENTAKFKVQLFSEADFRGLSLILEDSESSLPDGFTVASCKVLAGSWLAFEGQDFSGRMYVLDEGTYPELRAMGCAHADASILSLQIVGFEFSAPSIVLFERSGLKGKRVVLRDGVVNLQTSGGGGRVQSVLVEGGIWVLYEEINFRSAQILLRPGEVSDWRSFCHWKKIGSLRPLLQKQVPFHLRNRLSGRLMTVTGDLDDIKLMRVQEMEETQGFEQIWFFQDGHLRCKLLEECCLCPSSSVTIAGARVGLAPALDEDAHRWSISPEGFICYRDAPTLVLEVKGGHNYDKSQVVLNTLDPKKLQQQWLIEVL